VCPPYRIPVVVSWKKANRPVDHCLSCNLTDGEREYELRSAPVGHASAAPVVDLEQAKAGLKVDLESRRSCMCLSQAAVTQNHRNYGMISMQKFVTYLRTYKTIIALSGKYIFCMSLQELFFKRLRLSKVLICNP
jgi:hypothetical protein